VPWRSAELKRKSKSRSIAACDDPVQKAYDQSPIKAERGKRSFNRHQSPHCFGQVLVKRRWMKEEIDGYFCEFKLSNP
jgi:hypothetical protein